MTELAYGICDKCNQPVDYENSALALEAMLQGGKFSGFYYDRHVMKTETCEGSPSRRGMIEVKPEWAAAWKRVQSGEGKPVWA